MRRILWKKIRRIEPGINTNQTKRCVALNKLTESFKVKNKNNAENKI